MKPNSPSASAAPLALVLTGAPASPVTPDEADTRVQAETVQAALAALGYRAEIESIGYDLRPLAAAAQRGVALVFNLVEALHGDGRLLHLVPAVLESAGLPVTGASAHALYLTTHKPLAKRLMAGAGIPTPAWVESEAAARGLAPEARVIVKSVWEEASIGLDAGSVVAGRAAAALLTRRRAQYGGAWFAEDYVEGREFNLSLLESAEGPEVLPPAEILFEGFPAGRPRIVDYQAKWDAASFAYRHTPRRFAFGPEDAALLARLAALARACWALFGLRGYARVDFRVDQAGAPWVLEVNANPCLAPDAGFLAAAAEAGLTPRAVIARIVAAARPAGAAAQAAGFAATA